MKFLIQKVKDLKIYQNKKITLDLSQEDFCYLVYAGIEKGDEKKNLEEIVKNLENLQLIDVENKFNQTLKEIKAKIVFVSNITLVAGFEKFRINFNQALEPALAKRIFDDFVFLWQKLGYNVFKTEFGAYLEIESINLGPINFSLNL